MRVQSATSAVSSASTGLGQDPPGRPAGRVAADPGLPLRLGVLTERVTPELVDQVIDVAGAREERRRLLPARVVVCFVLGLTLFSAADSAGPAGYRSVLRSLSTQWRALHFGGAADQLGVDQGPPAPGRQALGAVVRPHP